MSKDNLIKRKAINSLLIYSNQKSKKLENQLLKISKLKVINKGDYLAHAGSSCNNIYWIIRGVLRGFVLINKREVTTWISIENQFATSITSFFTDKSSIESIQALENSILIYFTKSDIEKTFKIIPEFNIFVRKMLENYLVLAEHRNYVTRLPHAADEWEYLLSDYNKFINRVPLKYTASYLGVRPETLYRIRAKNFKKSKN